MSIRARLEWLYFSFLKLLFIHVSSVVGVLLRRLFSINSLFLLLCFSFEQLLAQTHYLELGVEFVHNSMLSVISCAAHLHFKACPCFTSNVPKCAQMKQVGRVLSHTHPQHWALAVQAGNGRNKGMTGRCVVCLKYGTYLVDMYYFCDLICMSKTCKM